MQNTDLLNAITDRLELGMAVIDHKRSISYSNRAYCAGSGLEPDDAKGMTCSEVLLGAEHECPGREDNCPAMVTFKTGHAEHRTYKIATQAGIRHLQIKTYPVTNSKDGTEEVLEVVEDITGMVQIEKQLLHAQRMKSLGTLTGGIAHHFKNALASIISYAEILGQEDYLEPEGQEYVKVIERTARSASETSTHLLDIARAEDIEGKPFDLNGLIKDVLVMLKKLIPEDVLVATELTHDLPPAVGSKNQFEQALVNLIINAKDAMPDGGTVMVKTSVIIFKTTPKPPHDYINPGKYILVKIRDTGTGIKAKDMKNIFEPFFTTKYHGQGTGLGLAITYRIIKRHGGFITVKSEIDAFTEFRIYLPIGASH